MKTTVLATALLLSLPAMADTWSDRTSREMIVVLQSSELAAVLNRTDTTNTIQGIDYLASGRASFGPAQYEVSFRSMMTSVVQNCSVRVNVNSEQLQVMSISEVSCN